MSLLTRRWAYLASYPNIQISGREISAKSAKQVALFLLIGASYMNEHFDKPKEAASALD